MASITITKDDARPFLIRLGRELERPRALMAVMGRRLNNELRDHFAARDRVPNARGWPKQHFWGQIRSSTGLTEVTDSSATVSVSDYRMRMKVQGGVITPKKAKALTIPLHPLAYGKRVSAFVQETGIDLFKPGPKDVATGVLLGEYQGKVVAFYALRARVTQRPDKNALPDDEVINEAMAETVGDFLDDLSTGRDLT